MSFYQITQLRRDGRLKEAYELAIREYNGNPGNIWAKRALGWVYYELFKNACERTLYKKIIEILSLISKLELPSDEKTFFESIAWQTGKYLLHNKHLSTGLLSNLFEKIKPFPFHKPAGSYSFLIKAFSKHSTDWNGFYDFFIWWGSEYFQEEDHKKTELENGKRIIADVEQVYIAVSKTLLKEPDNKQKIEQFLPVIEQLTHTHPEMQYPHYYFAKLLLATGNNDRFLKAFVPFARRKKRDFWIWDLLSEIFDRKDPRYFACLCRSLACNAPVKFSLNVKEKFARVLLSEKMFQEARHEVEQVVECRKKEGWRITGSLQNLLDDKRLQDVKPAGSNRMLYLKHAPDAEKLLCMDIPAELVVVERVNREKKIIYFVTEDPKQGSFLYHGFDINPDTGDVLAVRFALKENEKSPGFHKAASVETTMQIPPPEIFKEVIGKLMIKPGNSFGFVKGAFVPPDLVSAENLKNGQQIAVAALKSFNRKQNQWGWKAVKIIKIK